MDVETSDYSLDGKTWQLRLTKTSLWSNEAPGNHFITISFLDPCHGATLTAPAFNINSSSVMLFDSLSFSFTNLKSNINCGGITQELVYTSGPLISQLSTFTMSSYLKI